MIDASVMNDETPFSRTAVAAALLHGSGVKC